MVHISRVANCAIIRATYSALCVVLQRRLFTYINVEVSSIKNWSPAWRSVFNQMGIKGLLSVYLTALGLELRTSTMPSGGNGIFTTNNTGRNQHLGFYYGNLSYDIMSLSPSSSAMYGEGMLVVEASELSKWVLETKWKAYSRCSSGTDSGNKYKAWIFPVPFCTMRIINDAR